jgi:hypothetical protein
MRARTRIIDPFVNRSTCSTSHMDAVPCPVLINVENAGLDIPSHEDAVIEQGEIELLGRGLAVPHVVTETFHPGGSCWSIVGCYLQLSWSTSAFISFLFDCKKMPAQPVMSDRPGSRTNLMVKWVGVVSHQGRSLPPKAQNRWVHHHPWTGSSEATSQTTKVIPLPDRSAALSLTQFRLLPTRLRCNSPAIGTANSNYMLCTGRS